MYILISFIIGWILGSIFILYLYIRKNYYSRKELKNILLGAIDPLSGSADLEYLEIEPFVDALISTFDKTKRSK